MRLVLLIFNCLLTILLSAQPVIEVWYSSPVEKADGEYAETFTQYHLKCNSHHSVFVRQLAKSKLDYDESTQKIAMHFAGGPNWLYKDNVRQSLTHRLTSFRDRSFLVEDKLHPIDWSILPDKKLIGECVVQKARGKFRGRTYTAWFARSIPISNGPWKLGGLPGLILEAYDDDKLVVFLFHAISQSEDRPIEMPEDHAPKVSLKKYQEIFEEEVKQYFDFLNAQLKKEGAEVTYETGGFELWEYPE